MAEDQQVSDVSERTNSRIQWIDALRGFPIVLMICVYVYRGWALEGVTPPEFYYGIEMFLGFAPTFFLTVVGMSMYLSLNRQGPTKYHWKRGLMIFIGGFSISLVAMAPYKFNIFHIIGICILVITTLKTLNIGPKGVISLLFAIVLATPLVNALDPKVFQEFFIDTITPVAYARPDLIIYTEGNMLLVFLQNVFLAKSSYPIFPWLAYSLLGYLICLLLLSKEGNLARTTMAVGLFGGVAIIVSLSLTQLGIPIFKYPTTVNYFLLSSGSYLMVTGLIVGLYFLKESRNMGIFSQLEFAGKYAFEMFIIQFYAIGILSGLIFFGPDTIFFAMLIATGLVLLVFHLADLYGNRILAAFGFYHLTRILRPYALLLIVLSFSVGAVVYYVQVVLGVFDIRVVTYVVDNAVSFASVILVYWYLMVIRSKKQSS